MVKPTILALLALCTIAPRHTLRSTEETNISSLPRLVNATDLGDQPSQVHRLVLQELPEPVVHLRVPRVNRTGPVLCLWSSQNLAIAASMQRSLHGYEHRCEELWKVWYHCRSRPWVSPPNPSVIGITLILAVCIWEMHPG